MGVIEAHGCDKRTDGHFSCTGARVLDRQTDRGSFLQLSWDVDGRTDRQMDRGSFLLQQCWDVDAPANRLPVEAAAEQITG